MSAGATWDVAVRVPAPSLARHVPRILGYDERTPGPTARPELPGARVVAILELGPPITVDDARHQGGFVGGLTDAPTLTAHDGWQRGIQLDLSPTSARRLFGVPMAELARRVVSLSDLMHRSERDLLDELRDAPGWSARIDRVERWLRARLERGPAGDRRVSWALDRIGASGGTVDIRSLRTSLGVSERHLVALFREHVGVPPKLLARLVRFDRLKARVRRGPRPVWARLAAELGYCDQAHLSRDVRAIAHMTPTRLASLLRASPDLSAPEG